MVFTRKEIDKIITESVDEAMSNGEPMSQEQVKAKVAQKIMRLEIEQSRNRTDYDVFWRRKVNEDFPNHPDIKSDNWKKVYAYLYEKSLIGRNVNKIPKSVARTQKTAPKMPKGKAGELLTMLYNNFVGTERKGGVSSGRDEVYKALMNFHYKTNATNSNKNAAGGSWLTQANRAVERNKYKLRFITLCDTVNHTYSDVRSYVRGYITNTSVSDLRGVIDGVYYKLMTLNDVINNSDTIDELINLATLLARSAEGVDKKFYLGDETGKCVGIITDLQNIKKYSYEIGQTINELENFINNGVEHDIDFNGRITKSITEAVVRKVLEMMTEEEGK